MTPLATIAIPCFNAEPSIAAAIASALAQTARPLQVIVVDDGSTDRSREIVRGFGDAIELVTGEHRGGNHARNLALERARGTWIQFLDADDFLEPEKIAVQLDEAGEGDEADVIYSPYWTQMEADGDPGRTLSEIDTRADIFTQWINWQIPQTGGALWRTGALRKLGGWKEGQPCCQEHELYLRAIQARLRFVYAPAAHAVYRVWSSQTVCRKDPRLVVEIKTALIDEMRRWLIREGLWRDEHQRAAGLACFEMARTLAAFDVPAADAYYRDRQKQGLLRVAGAAAPRSYRLMHNLVGFKTAEKIASALRSMKGPQPEIMKHFSYDPASDQRYNFTSSSARVTPVEIDRAGFRWPARIADCDTAFLEMRIQARGRNACLAMTAGDAAARQYFEPKARGVRCANCSAIAQARPEPGTPVALRGECLAWPDQAARLLCFANNVPARPRLLVLAPHPDDAEIAACGLYRRSETTIVTVTAGDAAGYYLERRSRAAAEPGIRARVVDSLTVPWLCGVPPEQCVNLGYFDGALEEMHRRPDAFAVPQDAARTFDAYREMNRSPAFPKQDENPAWNGLVRDLAHLFREVRPDIVATPHPLLDDHGDHAFTTLAACEALQTSGLAVGSLFLYVNHSPRSPLHPFGSADGTVTLPPHFGEECALHSIYSEPLDERARELKFLALEAMHDLRSLPREDPTPWRRIVRAFLAEARGRLSGMGRFPTSCFRRAVRPNELFFTLPFSRSAHLRETFLREYRAGRIKWHAFS